MLANKLLSAGSPRQVVFKGSNKFTGSASSVTATAFDIGPAASGRVIVVCVGAGSTSARQVSGLTIGGAAATLAIRSASILRPTGIYFLAVAAGTTADIVVTFTGAVAMSMMCVYALTGWDTVTLYDSSTATNTGATSVTATGIDTANDGLVLQVASCNSYGSVSPFVQDDAYAPTTYGAIVGRKWPSAAATGTSITHTPGTTDAKSICVATFS